MKILLTNDDGIHAKGIITLAKYLKKIADVTIIAPESERSAVGVSLSLHKPLRLTKISENIYITDGTPVDCINLGLFSVMKNNLPDLVVSGINAGPNIAEDVFYSGTVGAVIEARMHLISGLSVSMFSAGDGEFYYDIAAKTAVNTVNKFFVNSKEKLLTFNLNLPGISKYSELKGTKFTRLDSRTYPGNIIERKDPCGKNYYWIGGNAPERKNGEDTDYNALSKKFASITPLTLDITDYKYLERSYNI